MNSLLYAPKSEQLYNPLMADTCALLKLDNIFGSNISEYFTTDEETIRLRLSVINDLSSISGLMELCEEFCAKIKAHNEFGKKLFSVNNSAQLARLADCRFYINLTDETADGFSPLINRVKSQAIKDFAMSFINEQKSENYKRIRENIERFSNDILNIKSITVGVNLSPELMPMEAGLVSVNTEAYKSGSLIDRLMRLDLKKTDFTCLAPLTTVEARGLSFEEQTRNNNAVLKSMQGVLGDALKKCGNEWSDYISNRISELSQRVSELNFLCRAVKFYREMKEKKLPVCLPEISHGVNGTEEYRITGLAPLSLVYKQEAEKIVRNDVTFDENGRRYILTGPNSGGKTVFVTALGAAQVMFQLGLPILATSAKLPILDGIYLQFPVISAKATIKDAGRLEEECREIAVILSEATENSMLLFDESFSSTSAKDGAVLAASTLEKIADIGSRCVFSTHIHELVEIIRSDKRGGADLLAAELCGETRTYRILRGRSEETSDAQTIAKKYGIIS